MRGGSFGRSLLLLGWLALGTTLLHGDSTNVLTWHNDIGRTGLNSTETILTQSNVNKTQFGKICSSAPGAIDGQLLAQPLLATGTIKGHNHVAYVATMNDSVYAFDGDGPTCAPIIHVSLLPAGEQAVKCGDVGDRQCHALAPIIGILSTPVIDLGSHTIYVVTFSESTNPKCATDNPPSPCFVHRLHALDLATLKEKFKGPVPILGSSGGIAFFSRGHIQRPGLLWLPKARPNGHPGLFVGFSMIDGAPNRPNGWVFGFDAKSLSSKPYVFTTTPGAQAGGGGVWGSGAGIAAGEDSSGGKSYLYFTTGDGVFDQGHQDFGDSFLKLTLNLSLVTNGFFAPFDQDCLESKDLDLGSSGVTLIPPGVGSSTTYFALTAGKDGNIYVMDRANPGGYNGTAPGCPGQGSNLNIETFSGSKFSYHTTAAYWNQNIYLVGGKSPLNKYQISSTCNPGPVCTTPVATSSNHFLYGPVPSVSSNDNVSGSAIVWAIRGDAWPSIGTVPAPALLYAYDAEHVGANNTLPELWDSSQCPTRDLAGNSIKFTVPTIANGMVYMGTMDPTDSTNTRGQLDVYGLVTGACN
jgi:hypothetical protein